MFEKLVDARYLHEHPEEVDSFWDYHLVLLAKLGYENIVAKFNPDWNTTVAKFKQPKRKGFRPRWNKLTLVEEAKRVGFEDHLHGAYYLPNAFIHNSAAEILFALEADENGRFTPKDFNNPDERRMAVVALQQALFFLIEMLKLQIEHYGWQDSAPLLDNFFRDYETYLRSVNSV